MKTLFVAPSLVCAASVAYLGVLGALSVDFGHHWDERLIRSVQETVTSGLVLPRWYNYPSLCYQISVLTAAPDGIAVATQPSSHLADGKAQALATRLGEPAFRLKLRSVFLILSLLSAVPTYALAKRLSGNGWIGLLAALCVTTSWEFFYHARWVAPDCLMMLFAIASVFAQYHLLTAADRCRLRQIWLCLAGLFAGLCVGAKYTGGIVLIPLLLAIFLSRTRQAKPTGLLFWDAVIVLSVFVATFIATTPGVVLEPVRFVRDVHFEMRHYASGHGGYTITPGWPHFAALMRYLGSVLLSRNQVAAVAASFCAVVGAASLLRKDWKLSVWFLSLPLSYVAHMASQHVMIVRNYLVLLPFIAVLFGLGVNAMMTWALKRPVIRRLMCSVTCLFIVYNAVTLTVSSVTIFRPAGLSLQASVQKHLANVDGAVLLSPRISEVLGNSQKECESKLVQSRERALRFVFASDEVTSRRLFIANTPGRYSTVWASVDEVNWDYYPSWSGQRRVLEIGAKDPEMLDLIDHVIRTEGSTGRK